MLLLLALALLAPAASGASLLVADDAGDVLRTAEGVRTPAEMAGADVRFVGVSSGERDARVTVGYGAPIPHDMELSLALQLGPEPSRVATVEVWRTVSDRAPAPTIAYVTASGEPRLAEGRAAFAEDAVQFVLPGEVMVGQPCFALRFLRSVHHAPDGVLYVDLVEPHVSCGGGDAPAAGVAENAQAPSSYVPPRDVDVPPAPLAFLLAASAVAALIRRR